MDQNKPIRGKKTQCPRSFFSQMTILALNLAKKVISRKSATWYKNKDRVKGRTKAMQLKSWKKPKAVEYRVYSIDLACSKCPNGACFYVGKNFDCYE